MSTPSLRDRRVVVIGGSSGIGFAVAQLALDDGAQVVIGSSGADHVETAVARLGNGASGQAVDVKDEASVAAFFERVGAFDHLVYTAGDWSPLRGGGAIAQLDLVGATATFTVRFWGALSAIKHAQGRISPSGSVTLTDGVIAHRPRKGAVISTAMAGAIEHMTRALAVDLAPLRVNAVCPGLVLTEVWNSIPADRREEQLRKMTEHQPLPRAADPKEVAQAYLYLIRGGFSTGQVLVVDGGRTLI
ncbi:MAG TPA: SDR family oxidoreductase [Pseudomonadales bacterium]|jgi:NAD(P)-dependent dehydrogenase (short-subunit alcohol dehydrogenase family)|nr:SDR family oxidoreductase [Pseudomonadales bacterium]